MTQITITDLEPIVVEKLKVRANRQGRTLEAELKAILTAAVESGENPPTQETLTQARERLTLVREAYVGRDFRDSAELLREDRQR